MMIAEESGGVAMSGVPYVGLLEGRDAAKVIVETPTRLALILDGLSTAEIETRPAPGKWSVREIIAHLADCEIAWSWRFRQVYGEEHATLQPFEQDAWAKIYDAYSFELAWDYVQGAAGVECGVRRRANGCG